MQPIILNLLSTLVRSNYGNNIEYIENYDNIDFFDSNDESLLN